MSETLKITSLACKNNLKLEITNLCLVKLEFSMFWYIILKIVPHPDVFWYCLNGMCAQKNTPKKVLTTIFPFIFHIKSKRNIAYKYLKTKTFSRDTNILLQMHWISNIFGHSATAIEGFWVSLNYWILNFKKTVCPKTVWKRHWKSIVRQFLFS